MRAPAAAEGPVDSSTVEVSAWRRSPCGGGEGVGSAVALACTAIGPGVDGFATPRRLAVITVPAATLALVFRLHSLVSPACRAAAEDRRAARDRPRGSRRARCRRELDPDPAAGGALQRRVDRQRDPVDGPRARGGGRRCCRR